jgi:hypothetical protein
MLLAMAMGLGLWSAPAAAQETSQAERLKADISRLRSEIDSLKKVQRGGEGEEPALKTTLKKSVFAWATEDGKFSLTMATRIQFRVTYNDERGQDIDGVSDPNNTPGASTNGRDFWNFKIARAETWFIGNIFEKEFKYYVEFAWAAGGDNIVQEAFFTWAKWQEFNINAGQTKTPYSWQFLVSSGRQQFVERSTVSAVFDQFYAKGLWFSGQIGKETPWIKYWAGVFNGVLRANNDFRNSDRSIRVDTFSNNAGGVDADLMPVIRVETHPLGEVPRDHTDQRSREESKKIQFSVGLGFAWFISRFSNAALRPTGASPGSGRSQTGQDTINLTLDGHFRFYGLSVNIEWHHRHTEFHNFGPLEGNSVTRNRAFPGDLTDNGFLFEVGFMILPKQLDVAFRFGMVDADEFWLGGSSNKPNGIIPDSTEIGLCVGYYLAGHNLKFLADFTYTTYQLVVNTGTVASLATMGAPPPSRSASSIANDNSDYLNVWQFRVQLAWVF